MLLHLKMQPTEEETLGAAILFGGDQENGSCLTCFNYLFCNVYILYLVQINQILCLQNMEIARVNVEFLYFFILMAK
uniref:Uncharacterized protein n=1 Tax=Anguilla anguilla TaxID=7936 RepID=A0A0E9W8K9_ANGAN